MCLWLYVYNIRSWHIVTSYMFSKKQYHLNKFCRTCQSQGAVHARWPSWYRVATKVGALWVCCIWSNARWTPLVCNGKLESRSHQVSEPMAASNAKDHIQIAPVATEMQSRWIHGIQRHENKWIIIIIIIIILALSFVVHHPCSFMVCLQICLAHSGVCAEQSLA